MQFGYRTTRRRLLQLNQPANGLWSKSTGLAAKSLINIDNTHAAKGQLQGLRCWRLSMEIVGVGREYHAIIGDECVPALEELQALPTFPSTGITTQ